MPTSGSTSPQMTKSRSHTLGRLVKYLFAEKVKVTLMIVSGLVGVGLIIVAPKVMAKGTDVLFSGILGNMLAKMGIPDGVKASQLVQALKASGHSNIASMISSYNVTVGKGIDWTRLAWILGITVVIYLASILFRLAENFLMTRVVSNAVYRMRQEIGDKINHLPLSYFDRVPRGEVMSRTTNDIDNISQSLQQILGEFFFSSFQFIGTVIMMLTISVQLTGISILVIPVLGLIIFFILKATQPQFTKQWDQTGKVNSHVEEMFSGHMVVRAYGQEEQAKRDFDAYNSALRDASFKAQVLSGTMNPITTFLGNISFVIVAIFGGVRVINGTLSLGDLQAFSQYSRQSTQPLGQLASMGSMLQSAMASASRIFEFLDESEESIEDDETTPKLIDRIGTNVRGYVEFKNVKFSYVPENPLIEDLSVTAQPGQTIAIVGPTGAGKTTLVNLLMRFYEINDGSIEIDGVDTRSITRHDLRSHFGMVLQDTWLFDGTIRDNLFYGVHDPALISEERMIQAAKATHVDEFVRRLPNGYDTVLNEDSTELSQGERQLLTICRAFLSDPDILILDEATSSVDTRTEMQVQNAMNTLRTGRTSFVIAHRLSTIRDADIILVVNHGSIVEQGNHDELMAMNGAYATLYNSQFTGAAVED